MPLIYKYYLQVRVAPSWCPSFFYWTRDFRGPLWLVAHFSNSNRLGSTYWYGCHFFLMCRWWIYFFGRILFGKERVHRFQIFDMLNQYFLISVNWWIVPINWSTCSWSDVVAMARFSNVYYISSVSITSLSLWYPVCPIFSFWMSLR